MELSSADAVVVVGADVFAELCSSAGADDMMCGGCVDPAIRSATGPCMTAAAACESDSVCKNALICMKSCNP